MLQQASRPYVSEDLFFMLQFSKAGNDIILTKSWNFSRSNRSCIFFDARMTCAGGRGVFKRFKHLCCHFFLRVVCAFLGRLGEAEVGGGGVRYLLYFSKDICMGGRKHALKLCYWVLVF